MKIKELFDKKEKWTKGTYARDKDGNMVGTLQNVAVCWCLSGAVCKCYPLDEVELIRQKITDCLDREITRWNDSPERTFYEVKHLVETLDI